MNQGIITMLETQSSLLLKILHAFLKSVRAAQKLAPLAFIPAELAIKCTHKKNALIGISQSS